MEIIKAIHPISETILLILFIVEIIRYRKLYNDYKRLSGEYAVLFDKWFKLSKGREEK